MGTKIAVKHEDDHYTIFNWCAWNRLKRLRIMPEGIGNLRKNRDHFVCSIVELG